MDPHFLGCNHRTILPLSPGTPNQGVEIFGKNRYSLGSGCWGSLHLLAGGIPSVEEGVGLRPCSLEPSGSKIRGEEAGNKGKRSGNLTGTVSMGQACVWWESSREILSSPEGF